MMGREMRNSGVVWIGKIPVEWEVKSLKAIFSFDKGLPITKNNLCESGIPVISYGQIHSKKNSGTHIDSVLLRYVSEEYLNSHPMSLVHQGDFIFADTSEDLEGCGNCAYDDVDMTLFAGYHSIILRAKNHTDNRYFAYLFKTDAWRKQIRERVIGVKLFSISQKILKSLFLIVPPQYVQTAIANYLEEKCAKIDVLLEKTRASIEEYNRLKQAVITQTVTKGIRGDRPMKESGVDWVKELPAEWEMIPSKFLFSDSDERKRPDDELLTASQKYGIISQKEYMKRENTGIVLATKGIENWKHVEPYDFVISLRSFQGGLEMSEVSGCITWHYIVLKPLKPIHNFYYKWLFKSELYIKALQRTCSFIRDGQDLRYSNFVQVPLFIPSMAEQEEIADYLNDRCTKIDVIIQEKIELVRNLEAYKKSLIYEYATGKKEVPQPQSVIAFVDARALLLCRIIELLKPKGRIHLMKALFTVDCLLNLNNETQYQRQKHGPYDIQIEEYERIMVQNGWINVKGGSPVDYILTKDFETYRSLYDVHYGNVDEEIQRICAFLSPMKTSHAERVATLLAVWNDFIIEDVVPTDKQIVQEVRSNWTSNKANSSESTWLGTLSEMKAHQIIPSGYGKHTIHMQDSEV